MRKITHLFAGYCQLGGMMSLFTPFCAEIAHNSGCCGENSSMEEHTLTIPYGSMIAGEMQQD